MIEQADQNAQAALAEELLVATYTELRGLAAHLLAQEPNSTLQATSLVHEAWLRVRERGWESPRHFFNAAAQAMRRILIDKARGRYARSDVLASLEIPASQEYGPEELEPLMQALDLLRQCNERWADVASYRFLLGLTIEQTADVLGVSPTTVKDDWAFARVWLKSAITRGADGAAAPASARKTI
jgi:RNA polymerase sigma factor (TIGR02999 family)